MVDVNTQNKTISVNVSSSGVSSNVNASGDASRYYSEKAREWAISNRIVDGVDYSSKYYAGRANQSALNAQSFAQSAQDSYKQFQDTVSDSLNIIDNKVQEATENIEAQKQGTITEIQDISVTQKQEIENLSEQEQNKIVNLGIDTRANVDLSNLSSDGEKHFLNKSQITNCILEIPQRIKLELNNGTLTLKAGSTVIVPNGFYDNGDKKFDYVTTTKDLSITPSTSFATGSYFITCDINGSHLSQGTVSGAISGETEPTVAHALWYNTTDNIIDRTGSDIALYNQKFSFPIAVVQAVNGTAAWTSIDQVLNGFGYIGNHIWCDKGVKGLIPNGRNTDGSLNNIEYTQQYIKTEYCGNNQNFIEGIGTGITQSNYYVEQEEEPTTNYTLWYKPSENKMYRKSGSGVVTVNNVFVGLEVTTGEGYITEFKPRQVFRAVDYNEFYNTPHIIKTYQNGASWYRTWSDGWCEQGGSLSFTASRNPGLKIITFLKSYADTNYYINFLSLQGSGGTIGVSYTQKTAESCGLWAYGHGNSDTIAGMTWYACGYIA